MRKLFPLFLIIALVVPSSLQGLLAGRTCSPALRDSMTWHTSTTRRTLRIRGKKYNVAAPPFFNDLTEINETMGQ